MNAFWDSSLGWFFKCSAWMTIFLAPARTTMIAVSFLVLGDLVTGIWASYKRKEKFSSAKLRQTITKTIGYQLAILLAFITENNLLPELPVLKVVAGLIASTELVSALENLAAITGVPLGAAVRKLFDKPVEPVLPVLPVLPVEDSAAGNAAAEAAKVAAATAVEVAKDAALKAQDKANKS